MITKLILSCNKATYLISLKEEGKLSLKQRVQLRAHLGVCSICKIFEKQTAMIGRTAKHAHEHKNDQLTEASKEKMQKNLQSFIEEDNSPGEL